MDGCNYWGYYSCFYPGITGEICCLDYCHSNWYDCSSLFEITNNVVVAVTTIVCGFLGSMTLTTLILAIRARKLARLERARMFAQGDGVNQSYDYSRA